VIAQRLARIFRQGRGLRRAAALGLCGAVVVATPALAEDYVADNVAVLQGLDKTTARVSTFEVPINGFARFGSLQISARACYKKPPTDTPESAAFLEIIDVRPDSPAVEVFNGWMFASSPAVSALEHPVYDVWVVDCKKETDIEEAQVPHGATEDLQKAAPQPAAGDDSGEFPEDPEGEAPSDGGPVPAQ
jgi:hypothetical protein